MDLFQDDIPNLDGTAVICGISAPDHRLCLFFDKTAASVLGDRIDVNVSKNNKRVLVVSRGASLTLEQINTESGSHNKWAACRRVKIQLHKLPLNVPLPFYLAQVMGIIRNGKIRIALPSMVET